MTDILLNMLYDTFVCIFNTETDENGNPYGCLTLPNDSTLEIKKENNKIIYYINDRVLKIFDIIATEPELDFDSFAANVTTAIRRTTDVAKK